MNDICHSLITRSANSPFWTIISSAPSTSQVIGVLAALVFGGMIFLLQEAPPSEDSDLYRYSSRALVTLLYAFAALTVASFFFSVVSGEQVCSRAFLEGTIASALFGSAAVGVFLSMCWLFAAHRIGGPHVIWVKVMTTLASLIAWVFVMLTLFDATQVANSGTQNFMTSAVAWWGIAPLLLPLIIIVLISTLPKLRNSLLETSKLLFEITLGFAAFSLAVTIMGFALVSVQHDFQSFPVAWRSVISGVMALNISLYLANMMIVRRVPPPNQVEAEPKPRTEADAEPKKEINQDSKPPMFRITIEIRPFRRSGKSSLGDR
jgi:hypothetical protein